MTSSDKKDVQQTGHLVVIGSSAGGIEALSAVLSSLPADFPAPIVIAQHLDPAHPTQLVGILSRHCDLPVQLVAEQEPFQPGTVYIVPPDHQVDIVDHVAHLTVSDNVVPRPSVDRLFTTAAAAFREDLIAVVLSGTGFDGAAGARMVHEVGGTVIIQNPETAAFPGMPRALAPVTVDIVANAEEIGLLLQRLVADEHVMETESEQETFRQILELVRMHRGMDFSQYRQPTIVRRLSRRMLATNNRNLNSYLSFLQAHPGEEEQLVSSFLIKVTDFFRDRQMFEYLRTRILPELIANAQSQPEGLRIWSAGCATGEEAYSVTILILELLRNGLDGIPVRVFATDLENAAVAFARRGVYPSSALKNVPPELIARYFREVNGEYEVVEEVRKLIVFGLHDLVQTPPFPHIDLILCRNVLMYFTTDLQSLALHALAFSLRRGGYLVLGSAESTRPLPDYYATESTGLRIFRRTERPTTFRSLPVGSTGIRIPERAGVLRRAPTATKLTTNVEENVDARARTAADSLLLLLPVGVAVVDDHYDIQTINVAAREMLGIHGVAIGEDIVHLLTTFDPSELRAAIDTVFKTNQQVEIDEVAATQTTTGQELYYQITCRSMEPVEEGSRPTYVVIVLRDVTGPVRRRFGIEQQLASQQDEFSNVVGQMQTMAATNRRLLEANEALTIAEEHWRALRDEYALANADAAAANEELETYAEELQASGEEMEALNEELKATVEELGVSNTNLDERARELMEQRQLQEDFVERASHELRTPLTAMSGYLQLISRRLERDVKDEQLNRMTQEARQQEERLEELVTELMDITRIQNRALRLDLAPVDLVPLVSRVVEVSRVMGTGLKIDLTIEPAFLTVNADVVRLEGVLYNLLTNAIKHAAGTPRIEMHLRQAADTAEITVRDYGSGIPEADLPHIFSRFYQVEGRAPAMRAGLGLGLYIAKEVVAAHGGTIDVTSKVGEGSTFTVRLPLAAPPMFDL